MVSDLITAAIQGTLDVVKDEVQDIDFEKIGDGILNKLEGFFEEGTIADDVCEVVAKNLREYFDIEDSDPDN